MRSDSLQLPVLISAIDQKPLSRVAKLFVDAPDAFTTEEIQSFGSLRLHYRPALLVFLALASLASGGCASSFGQARAQGLVIPVGRTHFVVLGFGFVSESVPTESAAMVIRTRVMGILVSDQPGLKLSVGLASNQTALVPAKAAEDVRIEAKTSANGTLQVTAENTLINHNPL